MPSRRNALRVISSDTLIVCRVRQIQADQKKGFTCSSRRLTFIIPTPGLAETLYGVTR